VAAVGFELFGVTLTVTRLVSAALGVLTILVAYRLGRALDGVRLGLVFSLLLAISPWHVTISRYGTQEHVLPPLQFLLSLLS
jgi:4-amino-4-deoxy-L-arabinose transferase-like glycosyltransferase